MSRKGFDVVKDIDKLWWDELKDAYGIRDLVDTADKPRWGKRGKMPNKHKTENMAAPRFPEKAREKYSGEKKPSLILQFKRLYPDEPHFVCLIGEFIFHVEKIPRCDKWRAWAINRNSWTTPTMIDTDPYSALLQVCAWPHWFLATEAMEHWGLIGQGRRIGLYAGIHFKFPGHEKKPKKLPQCKAFKLDHKHCKGNFLARPK